MARTPLVLSSNDIDESFVAIVDLDTVQSILANLKNPNRPRNHQAQSPYSERGEFTAREDMRTREYSVGLSGIAGMFEGGVRVPMIPLKRDWNQLLKLL